MINIEIDGKRIEVENGCSVIEAARRLGIYIPHFCYHKKLSIAANCRMCLVQVEKAPKPLPACATPVAEGMKVFTASEQAVKAQKGVMEFLLINHPLDCPICDQGGECELQDLAVGYGGSASRYQEEKRVVLSKDIGPLVAAEEMSRCINCTRCVRFGVEIGGAMELGQAFRGEHAEIMSFVSDTVDSELSGNMIDLCPVGALTSKPFRYSARTWELSRRKSVSPHDSLGSNLAVQVKNNRVMRVLPIENEAVNECWLSDRDRFSYEGLNSAGRLTKPMIKQGGKWQEADWKAALEYVANGLRQISSEAGAEFIGSLATPYSTLEELYLLQKLMRGLGSHNVDFRLRQSDFSADGKQAGVPWLGMTVADINQIDRFLIVGSFLRKDHPLLAARVRFAANKGAQVNLVHSADDELMMPVCNKAIIPPGEMVAVLGQVLKALSLIKNLSLDDSVRNVVNAVTPSPVAHAIASSLASGERVAILLGNFAQQHPQASLLQHLAEHIAALSGAKFGFLGEAANSVGGYLAQAVPFSGTELQGMNASAMLASHRKAYVLLNVEAELDTQNPQQALAAMHAADMVVAMSAYKHHAIEYADVLLPIAPFTETSGTFVNAEGRVQSFKGTVRPLGESRPAWKVLRVLGNLLNVPGFDFNDSEEIRDEALRGINLPENLDNSLRGISLQPETMSKRPETRKTAGLQRVSDVPIYATDSIVRRAASLQKTRDAADPVAWMHSTELEKLDLRPGEMVKLIQEGGSVRLPTSVDDGLPCGVVRVVSGHSATAGLAGMFGEIRVERA
ncbi:NADH-quinone oxidoreductase subunit NuoG [Candidatus Nitrotoga fabula]|uniref:NADH-quinone oxidoreductase n=1 Tax=Candidatus Nitrotoga fabula TaxID=2182327 RepID=A0A916BFA8_9PROT|nr:NADH-quinone oxidoreductase subunit NuoG [Candidatus Nitrotoga fabula]CAE6733834.1 NADH-ubiquinone oxidoreductase chain G [Candidatus Nitrotoga fabula]